MVEEQEVSISLLFPLLLDVTGVLEDDLIGELRMAVVVMVEAEVNDDCLTWSTLELSRCCCRFCCICRSCSVSAVLL